MVNFNTSFNGYTGFEADRTTPPHRYSGTKRSRGNEPEDVEEESPQKRQRKGPDGSNPVAQEGAGAGSISGAGSLVMRFHRKSENGVATWSPINLSLEPRGGSPLEGVPAQQSPSPLGEQRVPAKDNSPVPFSASPPPIGLGAGSLVIQAPAPMDEGEDMAFPEDTSFKTFRKTMIELGKLSFDERMSTLEKMCIPIHDVNGRAIGVGFKVFMKSDRHQSIYTTFVLSKGLYQSEGIAKETFSRTEQQQEYFYLNGYETVGNANVDPTKDKNIFIRLSSSNGELVSLKKGILSGTEFCTLIRAMTPLFRQIKVMYLFDDAKFYTGVPIRKSGIKKQSGAGAGAKEAGASKAIWIKSFAIHHQRERRKTFYEDKLQVVPARIRNWVLIKEDLGTKLLNQDPIKYTTAIDYHSELTPQKIYTFYKKYSKAAGLIERAIQFAFREREDRILLNTRYTFESCTQTFGEIYQKLKADAQRTDLPSNVVKKAKLCLCNFYDLLLVPWTVEGGTISESEKEYLGQLNTIAQTRIFLFR